MNNAFLREKITPPKRKFWKAEQTVPKAFSKHFSKGVSTRFGRRIVEKCFENAFGTVCSAFQNFRLGSIKMHIKSTYIENQDIRTV